MLTPPDRACIAVTGVQPGFSAECRVLAGTATTPPAEKVWHPAPSLASMMMHPTSSPAKGIAKLVDLVAHDAKLAAQA
jgi:hypothetical protein